MTTEQKVAETILQKKDSITIGGKTYMVGKPTVATIIMCSELISQLPKIRDVKPDQIVLEVLRTARNMRIIGEICAVLILGAKRVKEIREGSQKGGRRRFSLFKRRDSKENELETLSQEILLNASSKEISDLISTRLTYLDLGSFFGITTSLAGANILQRTKTDEVGETTQSGQ